MALIQVNFMSKSLMRTVPVQVILPVDKLFTDETAAGGEEKPFKTLYLLHGIFGNYTDWVSGTRIQRWAEEKDLAVVMPSGDNAFYVDQPWSGNLYGEFIGKELVEMTRKMFPLSRDREDTFIGGLSMGGFGALLNGLKYHETFSRIVTLSGAVHILDEAAKNGLTPLAHEDSCFGDISEAIKSDKNPKVLIAKIKEKMERDPQISMPKIFQACGTEDFLLKANREYRDYLKENGAELTYREGPGGHDWDFWDTFIREAIQWLPLDDAKQGVNSGNVSS
ncbi:MAG: acetylesterase [Lachnospiraceae bacterium]|nr:acetylesterase [Lachnospiraceae bacterium]